MNEPVFYERADGKWAWRVVAANGETVGNDGGQGFRDETDARRAFAHFLQGLLRHPAVQIELAPIPLGGRDAEETTAPPES